MSPASKRFAGALGAGMALLMLGGCAYDYLQRSDQVGYDAGNAVAANMAIQTTDPSKDSQYKTGGLGKDGNVIPDGETTDPAAD